MSKPGREHSSRRPRRTSRFSARAGALITVASAVVLAALSPPALAGSSSSSLASSAAALEAQIVKTGKELHATAVEVAAASARLTAADQALQSDQAVLSTLQTQLTQATTTLRAVALAAYMRDSSSSDLSLFDGSPTQATESQFYARIVAGSESDSIDRYLRDEQAVVAGAARLNAQRAAAAADYASIEHDYAALQAEANSEQASLDAVRTRQAQLAAQGLPSRVNLSVLAGDGSFAQDLYRLRVCESNDNYSDNTGNGYYGAYQFSLSTWQGLGYGGLPSNADPATQDEGATRLVQADGWSQWPACAAMLGLD